MSFAGFDGASIVQAHLILGWGSLFALMLHWGAYEVDARQMRGNDTESDRGPTFLFLLLLLPIMLLVIAAAVLIDRALRPWAEAEAYVIHAAMYLFFATIAFVFGLVLTLWCWLLSGITGWSSPPLRRTITAGVMAVPATIGLILLPAVGGVLYGTHGIIAAGVAALSEVAVCSCSLTLVALMSASILRTTWQRAVVMLLAPSLLVLGPVFALLIVASLGLRR